MSVISISTVGKLNLTQDFPPRALFGKPCQHPCAAPVRQL